jgi:hypothetical protein
MTEPADKKAPIKVLNGSVQNHVTQEQPPRILRGIFGGNYRIQNTLPPSRSNNGTHRP